MSRKRKDKPAPAPAPAAEPGLSFWAPVPAAAVLAAAWLLWVWAVYAGKKLAFAPGDWRDVAVTLSRAPAVVGGTFLKTLALAGLTWVGAAGWGCALRRRLAGPGPRCAECFVVNAALGFGALSLLLLALGLLGFFTETVLRWQWGAGVMGGGTLCWMAWHQAKDEFAPAAPEPGGLYAWTAGALILLAALSNLLAALAPEVFYDSLVYHLALPKLYLLRGALTPTPENLYAGLPLGAQMLYGLALSLSGDDLAAFMHALFGLGAAAGVFCCVRRLSGPRAGAVAAVLYYLCPLILYASWGCGVDLVSAFYVTAAFCALTGAVGQDPARAGGRSVVLGLLAGFAAGTKLNVAPVAGALWLAHAVVERREGRGWRGPLLMAGAAAAAVSPWLAKNAVHYGNPVYPFLHERLGTLRPADWKAFLEAAGSRDLRAAFSSWAGLWDLLSLPYRCVLGNWPLGDWAGPVFASLLPWTFLAAWWRRGTPFPWRLAGALAAAGVLAWWAASSLVRYLVPSLPLVAAATALAVEGAPWPRAMKSAAWGAAVVGSLLGFQCAWRQGAGIGQWAFVRGQLTRPEYLGHQRVTYGLPYVTAADWVNSNLPASARLLLVGESRGFYLERDFTAATVYDFNPLWVEAAAAKDPADLAARLKARGFTHILLSARQLHFRRDSEAVLPRAVAGSPVVDGFMRSWLEKLWEDRMDPGDNPRWLTVYRLLDRPAAAPSAENPVATVLDVLRRQKE